MPRLSLAKLERHLYAAADRLRQEGLDAATYKDYIFGLLFLKRCSDVFDAEREGVAAHLAIHDRQTASEQAVLSKLRQLKSGLMTDRWKTGCGCRMRLAMPRQPE